MKTNERKRQPNEGTGATAGGRHRLPIRALWAARIAEFRRSVKSLAMQSHIDMLAG
jgi:ribosomal protein L19E